MGTNFFWRFNACDHCERYNEAHVGKRSGGWSFGFRAWPHKLMDENYPDWGYDPESPFGFEVMSRADWREVFTVWLGRLFDEYGREEPDPLAWLDGLAVPDAEQIGKEDSPEWLGPYADTVRDRQHRDAEGFRFGAYEFS